MVRHAEALAWVWGSERPAFSIGFGEPESRRDSGFTVLFGDAPDPEELDGRGTHPAVTTWCLGCMLEEHPEIGRGLDLAFEYGVADLDEQGVWVVGDLSRLEST